MKIEFSKYQGTGNDFVMINGFAQRAEQLVLDQETVAHICDRRFGVGADGLIILRPREGMDFYMEYYNSDGRLSSMCGNGSRCAIAFAGRLGLINNKVLFGAIDGLHEGHLEEGNIRVLMNVGTHTELGNGDFTIDTGSPHYVRYVKEVREIDVDKEGRQIRESPAYRNEGINVNFVERLSKGRILVATYERGVEAETYSCGTGVTACALIEMSGFDTDMNEIEVVTKGGTLWVRKPDQWTGQNIWLEGPAVFVYSGAVTI